MALTPIYLLSGFSTTPSDRKTTIEKEWGMLFPRTRQSCTVRARRSAKTNLHKPRQLACPLEIAVTEGFPRLRLYTALMDETVSP